MSVLSFVVGKRPATAAAPDSQQPKRRSVNDFICTVCSVSCNSDASLQRHLLSGQHRQRVSEPVARARPAPPQDLPVRRLPGVSASAQLTTIVSHHFETFAAETVTAMFLLRSRRLFNTVQSRQMENVVNIEHFAELMLTTLSALNSTAHRARRLLACDDLPQGASVPTLVLSSDARFRLQFDCLHREFQKTSLRRNVTLLHIVVKRCLADGTAQALISDVDRSESLSNIASEILTTAALPGSVLHRAWHEFDMDYRLQRSQSETNLSTSTACFCLPPTAEEDAMIQIMTADMNRMRVELAADSDDSDYIDFDY